MNQTFPFQIMFNFFIDILMTRPQHGSLGVVDEILLYCVPPIIALMILAAAAQRASGKKGRPERVRTPKSGTASERQTDSTNDTPA